MSIQWLAADWPAPGNVHAGTTLRGGGVSCGAYAALNLGQYMPDDWKAVVENRRRFIDACDLPAEPRWLRQTHSVNVAIEQPLRPDPGTDALVSRQANTVCTVLTADCLPVVFTAVGGDEIAAAHAGWRGLCNGILESTVAKMSTEAANLLAWLGPAISQDAFEVGAEVREQFMAVHADADRHFVANARGRFQADLYGLARQRLATAGVTEIFGGGRCTAAEADSFYSYRRDGECGRMATFIYRSEAA